jgi:hypothetical protein
LGRVEVQSRVKNFLNALPAFRVGWLSPG